jgi:hypothetical protein
MSLECERCGHEPAARDCPACGEPTPLWARFCPLCGADQPPEETGAETEITGNRRLCPDGNCIGILNDDGRCVVCGQSG